MSAIGTPRARELGAGLRQARLARQMTLRQVADAMGRNESHPSRWENGKLVPSAEDIGALVHILGIGGDERDRIIHLAREMDNVDWVAPGIGKQLAALIEAERVAVEIVSVEPLLVPGLLQTEEYAYSIIEAHGGDPCRARQEALVRVGRQTILTRRRPPKYVAAIGESALRYAPCSPQVMADQLHRLLVVGQQPNVTIVVVPNQMGHYSPAVFGPFWVIDADNGPMVYLESSWSSTLLSSTRAVDAYRRAEADVVDSSLGVE
ncbi:MAG TPA: helix-turn-helix transcriptional regulator, partial [Pseudonocardiaceae bacterium]